MAVWIIETRLKGTTNEDDWEPLNSLNCSEALAKYRVENWFSFYRDYRAVEYVRKENHEIQD